MPLALRRLSPTLSLHKLNPRLLHRNGTLNSHASAKNKLDRGSLDKLPTHIDFPFLDGDRLFVRVVYSDKPVPEVMEPKITPAPLSAADIVDDQTLVHRGVRAFLKVFDDILLRDDVASKFSSQGPPDILVIDKEEFNKRVEEHKANR